MKKYAGLSELPKRNRAFVSMFFFTVPMIALGVMVYQDPDAPVGAWIAIAVLAALDLLMLATLMFPRTYLTVDLSRRVATFVERGSRREIPLAELEPLYLHKITGTIVEHAASSGRPTGWWQVESKAAPVLFYRSAIEHEHKARRAIRRLNAEFGFTFEGPLETEYLPTRVKL